MKKLSSILKIKPPPDTPMSGTKPVPNSRYPKGETSLILGGFHLRDLQDAEDVLIPAKAFLSWAEYSVAHGGWVGAVGVWQNQASEEELAQSKGIEWGLPIMGTYCHRLPNWVNTEYSQSAHLRWLSERKGEYEFYIDWENYQVIGWEKKRKGPERYLISIDGGIASISFPSDWMEDIDLQKCFHKEGRHFYFRFGAFDFDVEIIYDGPRTIVNSRVAGVEAISLEYGPLDPWFVSSPRETSLFGRGSHVVALDQVIWRWLGNYEAGLGERPKEKEEAEQPIRKIRQVLSCAEKEYEFFWAEKDNIRKYAAWCIHSIEKGNPGAIWNTLPPKEWSPQAKMYELTLKWAETKIPGIPFLGDMSEHNTRQGGGDG